MKQLMKAFELMVPGVIVLAYIVMTGIGGVVGASTGNANMFLIGILAMLQMIAILLANTLRVLWQIRDKMNGGR